MKKVFLWGGKLKARLADHMIREAGDEVAAIFDSGLDVPAFATKARFSNDPHGIEDHLAGCSHFVVCIGGERGVARAAISDFCEGTLGLSPLALIHPTAYISEVSHIGKGFQAMPRAIVHHFSTIGDWSIVNTNAHVDHECVIGSGVHIMGGAALAGQVTIGDHATIGTNATILPGITIGAGAYVGAGAVVTKNVGAGQVVTGVPARVLRESSVAFDPAILEKMRAALK